MGEDLYDLQDFHDLHEYLAKYIPGFYIGVDVFDYIVPSITIFWLLFMNYRSKLINPIFLYLFILGDILYLGYFRKYYVPEVFDKYSEALQTYFVIFKAIFTVYILMFLVLLLQKNSKLF